MQNVTKIELQFIHINNKDNNKTSILVYIKAIPHIGDIISDEERSYITDIFKPSLEKYFTKYFRVPNQFYEISK